METKPRITQKVLKTLISIAVQVQFQDGRTFNYEAQSLLKEDYKNLNENQRARLN